MFRQVIAHRWAAGTSETEQQAYRDAMERLRPIPELVALRYGDDAGHFPGNHDFVAVLDFPDFAAARRYVAAEPHCRFVEDHAMHVVDARIVVQHDWGVGTLSGLHHVKLPVIDIGCSRDWYVRVFGFRVMREFREDGVLRGVALHQPDADLVLALRVDPTRARALAGFDALCLAVGTRADLDAVLADLDHAGVPHSEPVPGHRGHAADVPDPDGLLVRLHTSI